MSTGDAEGRESVMRQLLVQLEMTSNGSTQSWDASGGGERDHTPRLGYADAPHLHYANLWDLALDEDDRQRVLDAAANELDAILHSRADRTIEESEAALYARIVSEGEGLSAREASVRFRCGIRMVHAARRQAGRDLDRGERPRSANGSRRAELEQLLAAGHSIRQAAFKLRISHQTALRDLGHI